MTPPLELSLYSGAGGGLLGSHFLGTKVVGYVEKDEYCQKVLQARMRDGLLHDAPIFDCVKDFISLGYAATYSGMVDIITAGFPCQPHSLGRAGKFDASNDPRDLWWETGEVIRIVRPRWALLENVRHLVTTGYISRVLIDLAAMGYDAVWGLFRASDVGAPHTRARWFCLASDPSRVGQERDCVQQVSGERGVPWRPFSRSLEDILQRPDVRTPRLCRVGDGVANRMERHGVIGNGQVPQVVWFAFGELMRRARYLQLATSRQAEAPL